VPAKEIPILDYTLVASSDFSASQFFFAACDANGQAALCGNGAQSAGVVQNKPSVGQPAALRPLGVSKVTAGAAVAKGALVGSDATGRAKPAVLGAATGTYIAGIALDDATAAGQVISVLLMQMGAGPTTAG
jgi:hypothetical protein